MQITITFQGLDAGSASFALEEVGRAIDARPVALAVMRTAELDQLWRYDPLQPLLRPHTFRGDVS